MPTQLEKLEAEWRRPGASLPPVDQMRSLLAEAEARDRALQQPDITD